MNSLKDLEKKLAAIERALLKLENRVNAIEDQFEWFDSNDIEEYIQSQQYRVKVSKFDKEIIMQAVKRDGSTWMQKKGRE